MTRREMERSERTSRSERGLFAIPSRFMMPRILLYLTTFALVALGLLMIYSSSSITAMVSADSDYSAVYYVQRQLIFGAVGLVAAAIVAVSDYHIWSRYLLPFIWIGTTALLAMVLFTSAGAGAYGATRWIVIGGVNLQPSEFAKVTIILTAAEVFDRFFGSNMASPISFNTFIVLMIVGVGLPLILIVYQPDKGTTLILAATFVVMGYLAGVPRKAILIALAACVVLAGILAFKDKYSTERVLTMLNPWRDPYDNGYQLVQGYYAFGSGGLFGVGVGLSRQKYSYLPMAYNDFIFAIIGEELGLVGTLSVLFAFAVLVWAGFQIARYAPDLSGRLIAAGSVSLILIQLLVNVCGVLGMIPLSGKPLPFVSYGGSSIISCLLLVGFVASVSRHSSLPDTVYEARRRNWSLSTSGPDDYTDRSLSLVGEPTLRSARGSASASSSISSYATTPSSLRASREFSSTHAGGRVSVDANGRRRIDLGPSATERLRSVRGSSRERS